MCHFHLTFFKRWGSNLFHLWDRGALTTNTKISGDKAVTQKVGLTTANVHWLQSDASFFNYLPSTQKTILSAINKRCKCPMLCHCNAHHFWKKSHWTLRLCYTKCLFVKLALTYETIYFSPSSSQRQLINKRWSKKQHNCSDLYIKKNMSLNQTISCVYTKQHDFCLPFNRIKIMSCNLVRTHWYGGV